MLYFGFDHRIRALVVLARALWLQGRADDALRVVAETLRDAALVRQPTTVAIALIYTSSVYLWSGDLDAAGRLSNDFSSTRRNTRSARTMPSVLGKRERFSSNVAIRPGSNFYDTRFQTLDAGQHVLLQLTFYLALAEGLASIGRFGDALAAVDAAVAETARNHWQSFDLPEIHRIRGSLLAAAPNPNYEGAERHLAQAIEHARAQGALGWELRAATATARLWSRRDRTIEGRVLLEATYGRFSQGFENEGFRRSASSPLQL